ncbi:ATP-binding protein [Streptomyces blattellae]|uniref:ATP-binding protein n=1 Tax=Streptomyces blattellae TaxID=2569855 RepID=UPI0012B73CB0|nr:ATP-binding protein [Streptomyces blattellae]
MTMMTAPSPVRQAEPHPEYTQTFVCLPESVSLARMSVRTTLTCWDRDSITDDAELIVSELATNALRHGSRATEDGPGHFRLTVELPTTHTVRMTVSDSSPRRPVRRTPGNDSEHGRGLAVVAALSSRWDADTGPAGGKRVWAELTA